MPTNIEKAAINVAAIKGPTSESLRALTEAIESKYPGAIARRRAARLKERDAARFKGNPPDWAKKMVRKHERSTNAVTLNWRRSRTRSFSSGRCRWDDRIVVTAGSNELDQRHVLAHELAHHVSPSFYHDDMFYETLLTILRSERLMGKVGNVARGGEVHALRRAARRLRKSA